MTRWFKQITSFPADAITASQNEKRRSVWRPQGAATTEESATLCETTAGDDPIIRLRLCVCVCVCVCACVVRSVQFRRGHACQVAGFFLICCCSAGGGGERRRGDSSDWLSGVEGGSLSRCLYSSLRPVARLPGTCSRSENSGSGCGASGPSTSVKPLPGSCRPPGGLSSESVVPPCHLLSATSLGVGLWSRSASVAAPLPPAFPRLLSESALCRQREAIVFTQGCSNVCAAVSLSVGSGWTRPLTRPLASAKKRTNQNRIRATCVYFRSRNNWDLHMFCTV